MSGPDAPHASHDALPATPEALLMRLAALEIAHSLHHHPAVFTVSEAQIHTASLPGLHIKNLCLKDRKGRVFLVVVEHETVLDLRTLHLHLSASGRLSFVQPPALMQLLGVEPGSVTPFAVVNDPAGLVTVALDHRLPEAAIVNAHPLRNTMTVAISGPDLLRFLRAERHEPMILDRTALRPA